VQGRVVSFKNTLVLLTSNIGSRVIAASSGGGLAAFGSTRSLMGGGDEADDAISKAEQVRCAWWSHCCHSVCGHP
jgi:ATP-dependent Clp protease ATP-binding subunit ClpA